MNKLFAKIASLTLGLALVAGAGVALASNAKEAKGVKADDTTIDLTAQGFSNAQEITTVTSGTITLTFSKGSGSNAPKYYTSGASVRTYASNTLTVTTSGSDPITSIVFTLGGTTTATPTVNTGTYNSSSKTWSGSASSVVFTNAASGQYHYKTVAVTTSAGGGEEDPVLQSIAVSGEKTEYTVGDEFIKPTVTATYDKGDPQDVTADATCTGYNMGVAGEYTVTVSYGGKTATYDIVVSAAEPEGDVLYTATFTDVANHSYTQNKEFSLNEKDWIASVSQVNGGVFYLGCNSTHASKGILNDNATFADVVTALAAEDTPYANAVSTAHAYAMLFDNAYECVGSVEFVWAGGNNAFQVYLFGDHGEGYELLAHTNYATSSATTSGFVKWNATGYGEDFERFAIVARPGATGSTATSKTLRAATFKIVKGEEEHIDPGLKTMVIKESGNPAEGGNYLYSSTADLYAFKAFEESAEVSGVTWSTSNAEVATINASTGALTTVTPGDVVVFAEADGYNKASASISIIKGSLESLAISGAMSKTSYTTSESWDPTGLVVTATYSSGWMEEVTSQVSWGYNPASPAKDVTSVVATATLDEIHVDSAAQAVTVTVAHAGTAEDPFTVAEALAKCAEIGAVGNTGQGPWVTKGIISRVTSAPAATYWNATYYISDDGTQNNELQVYRGFYLDNAKFDAETALLMKAGNIVTVTGNLTGSYGSEYCQGNYLLAIEEPSSGDVDVTFNPAITSFEIGDSGTFTASSETAGVVYTWAVDNSSILSVDENTGAYEALGLGVARVTVTATLNDKSGTAFVDFTINGKDPVSVSEANGIASSVESGKTTSYYIYVEGYVKEFATSMSGDKPRAIDIMDLEGNKIMVYTNVNPYSDFIDGLALGDYIVVKGNVQNYSGTYEITSPEKISSNYSAVSLAFELLSNTNTICADYDGVTDNGEAIASVWESLSSKYEALSDKDTLINAKAKEGGTTVEEAMARYDYLTAKYELDSFISGRPASGRYSPISSNEVDSNAAITIITIIAVTSISAIAVLLVIKKRKTY